MAAAAAPHPKVNVSICINAPIERVWQSVRAFCDLSWCGMTCVPESEERLSAKENLIGMKRLITVAPGATVVEILTAFSEADHYYSYHITHWEKVFPGKVENYHATLRLQKITVGDQTLAQWTAEFDGEAETVEAVANMVKEGVFEGGLKRLRDLCQGE
ncbi:hypothetical protein QOT17_004945 [Balamuthia mandrillaris]